MNLEQKIDLNQVQGLIHQVTKYERQSYMDTVITIRPFFSQLWTLEFAVIFLPYFENQESETSRKKIFKYEQVLF